MDGELYQGAAYSGSKDYTQRIKVVTCSVNEKGLPLIDPEILPEPLPKVGKDLLATLEAESAEVHADQSVTAPVEPSQG